MKLISFFPLYVFLNSLLLSTNLLKIPISAPSAYEPASTRVDISSLPSAPRAQREGSFDPSRVPRSPPFTAYVGNLPFDTEDDDVIQMFARNTVRIVNITSETSVTV